jgi:anti-sigma factor ChrR (cupin superfamily)
MNGEKVMSDRGHRDISAAEVDWHDGSGEGIRFAHFPLDEVNAHAPTVILTTFGPGTEVPPHTHDTNYFEYIIEGEQSVGKRTFAKGDVRLVKGGTGYGPIKVGPKGCTVLIVFEDGSRAMMETLPRRPAKVGGLP